MPLNCDQCHKKLPDLHWHVKRSAYSNYVKAVWLDKPGYIVSKEIYEMPTEAELCSKGCVAKWLTKTFKEG